jgi:hypothetical protein
MLLGVPLALPLSSTTCVCGHCGHEFRSQTWDYQKTVSPDEAASLDTEEVLRLTNPSLMETVTLSRLKPIAQLSGAFQLLDQLPPGGLRAALKSNLLQWSNLERGEREHLLAQAHDCGEALQFARSMAARFKKGVMGCLVGTVVSAGAWAGCLLAFGTTLSWEGWLGVIAAGIVVGFIPCHLLWSGSDQRWLDAVLLPEAEQAGILAGWLLAVL